MTAHSQDGSHTTKSRLVSSRHIVDGCRWQHKGKKKKQTGKEDLYALLGLANERWTANDNQIKLGQFCCSIPVLSSLPPAAWVGLRAAQLGSGGSMTWMYSAYPIDCKPACMLSCQARLCRPPEVD